MNTKDLISMAVRNLLKRKLRTVLTVLGVVIGTASIVVMISIGIGMNESFAKQLEGWGSLQVIDKPVEFIQLPILALHPIPSRKRNRTRWTPRLWKHLSR